MTSKIVWPPHYYHIHVHIQQTSSHTYIHGCSDIIEIDE